MSDFDEFERQLTENKQGYADIMIFSKKKKKIRKNAK